MKSRIIKLAAAAVIAMIGLGLIPLNGTTVLVQIIKNATSVLTRLRILVQNENLPAAEHVERQIDKSVKILTKGSVYSSFEISLLENFLNEQSINFISGAFENVKYATIPSDKVDTLQEFLKSQGNYKIVTSLNVLAYAGQEAMIAIIKVAGVAITALQDENKQLNLDVAFHNGQDGFEITQIKLKNGEALLISGIVTRQDESPDKLVTILLFPEVIHYKK